MPIRIFEGGFRRYMRKNRTKIWLSIFLLVSCSLATIGIVWAYSNEDPITYYPAQTDEVLNNPFMGFVADARYIPKTENPPHRLAHVNLTWKEIEPQQGVYAFDELEQKNRFDEWTKRGAKLIIRLILDDPSDERHMDIPDWLYEATNKKGTFYDTDHGQGFSPDYFNPTLIEYHRKLIEQLAKRYNGDPRIAFVELGSIGHWGEWHTKNDEKTKIPFPNIAIADQYVQPYIDYFTEKHLMMRRPYPLAQKHNFGLFNDMFGDHEATIEEMYAWINDGYTFWLTKEPMPAMRDYWAKAPGGGEFSSTHDQEYYFKDKNIEETLKMVRLTHPSWLGPYALHDAPVGSELERNANRFLNTIGYRFILRSETHVERVHAGDLLDVEMEWFNAGVAPFYYRWPLELSLADESGTIVASKQTNEDIRTWQPGTKVTKQAIQLPQDLPSGNYTLCVAVLDPDSGEPGVQLAIEGKRPDGRYTLGPVIVK